MDDGEKIEELHKAVRAGQHDAVRRLIVQEKTPVDGADILGRTALHVAASKGDCEMIDLLAALHATIDARDNSLQTPLFLVPKHRPEALSRLLALHAYINAQDNMGGTVLHKHVQLGNGEMVGILLNADADRTIKDKRGNAAPAYATGATARIFEGPTPQQKRATEAARMGRLRARVPGGLI